MIVQNLKAKWTAFSARVFWPGALFLTLTPLATAILLPIYFSSHSLTWTTVLFFVIGYMLTNMSITVGYHRLFAHRSYDAHPILETLIVFVSSAAFQGSILQWATDHRRHHAKVDSNEDPYTIKKGFWYAHLFWMMLKDDPKYAGKYAADLQRNPLIKMQHDYYGWFATGMGFVLPALIGEVIGLGWFGGFVIGGLLRVVLTQHSTFFINSLCHYVGNQPYSDRHSARDSFIMAVLTFGEGYHNYHHEFQIDYRNGIRWYHWDPTKWSIRTFAFLGLATKLRRVAPADVLRVRLTMEAGEMLRQGASAERVQAMRTKIEDAQARLRLMHDEYKRMKASVQAASREKYRLVRTDMELARLDFQTAVRQWKMYHRTLGNLRTA